MVDFARDESLLRTYMAATAPFTPAAAATDIFVLGGATDKVIRVLRVMLSGIQTTAGNIGTIALVKRSTATSGGTAVVTTKVPVDTGPAVAASAVVQHYTANPTVGTLVGALYQPRVLLPAPASVASGVLFDLDMTDLLNGKLLTLYSASEQIAINMGGGTLPTGAAEFQVTVVWTEAP